MYTQLKKGLSFAFALAMAIMVSGNAYATEKTDKESKKEKARVTTTYYFHSNNLSEAANPAQWSTTPSGFNCAGSPELPCQITLVDEDIETYLEDKDPSDVMADPNVAKRPQQ
ncbi:MULTISPECIES: hypothetical protein [Olivibacter]|uniref:Uncharacterized protein n=1 Tax=Olivibacter jilunii TaxID=985016 RepID=A0ABW6B916_9SPHI|nr:hypothetical protein [Pseudosphingobacterium sp.]